MGFWSTLGKIGLQAAPYVAAPFTGGASLYAVPATQKAGQAWAQHDANEAAKKGLAPSNADKYINGISSAAGVASGLGALGKLGAQKAPVNTSKPQIKPSATTGGITSGNRSLRDILLGSPGIQVGDPGMGGSMGSYGASQGALGQILQDVMNRGGGNRGGGNNQPLSPARPTMSTVPQQGSMMSRRDPNPLNFRDQSFPNLAESIFRGRNDAQKRRY